MEDVLKGVVIYLAFILTSIIVSIYVFYFFGMTVSLLAGNILGVDGLLIASIFAWIGIVFILAFNLIIVSKAISRASSTTIEFNADDFKDHFNGQ